jgi:hypothetical protein
MLGSGAILSDKEENVPCRHLRFQQAGVGSSEWVPMALREATCALRSSNPDKWNQVLRCEGIDVDHDDVHCPQNLEGSYHRCPLYIERNPNKNAALEGEDESGE